MERGRAITYERLMDLIINGLGNGKLDEDATTDSELEGMINDFSDKCIEPLYKKSYAEGDVISNEFNNITIACKRKAFEAGFKAAMALCMGAKE